MPTLDARCTMAERTRFGNSRSRPRAPGVEDMFGEGEPLAVRRETEELAPRGAVEHQPAGDAVGSGSRRLHRLPAPTTVAPCDSRTSCGTPATPTGSAGSGRPRS